MTEASSATGGDPSREMCGGSGRRTPTGPPPCAGFSGYRRPCTRRSASSRWIAFSLHHAVRDWEGPPTTRSCSRRSMRRAASSARPTTTRRYCRTSAELRLVLAVEDLGDAGVLEHGAQGVGDDRRDREDGQLPDLLLLRDRHRIRDHDFLDRGLLDLLHGLPAEQPVRGPDVALAGPLLREDLRPLHHRAAGVDHVVHDEARPALDLARQVQPLALVRLVP